MVFPSVALLRKELLVNLRRPAVYWTVALVLGASSLSVMAVWPAQDISFFQAGFEARRILMQVAWVLLAGCGLFVPALAASAIVNEKEQGTYEELRLTLIRPSGLIFAKFLGTVGIFLLLIVASLPVLSATLYIGTIDWQEIAMALGVLLTGALSCAMAGLLCSALFRKMTHAVAAAYVAMFILLGGPIHLVQILIKTLPRSRWVLGMDRWWAQMPVQYISPVRALSAIYSGSADVVFLPYGLAFHLIVAALCAIILAHILRRPVPVPRVEQGKPIDDFDVLRARRRTFPYYLIDPLHRKPPIEDLRNPVLVKELRWETMHRAHVWVRVFSAAFLLFFAFGAWHFVLHMSISRAPRFFVLVYLTHLVMVPALVAPLMTKERDTNTLEMLRTTLLRPSEILFGKALAALVAVTPVLGAGLFCVLPILVLGYMSAAEMTTGFVSLFPCVAISFGTAVFAGSTGLQTRRALLLAYALSLLMFFGLPALAKLFEVIVWGPSALDSFSGAAFLSPILGYLENTGDFWKATTPETVWNLGQARAHTFYAYDYGISSLVNAYWAGNVLLHTMIGFLFVGVAVRWSAFLATKE
ncbi:MAG: ABC transporter permease [Candidatus Hydrogenedentes bacterium]|nr:ABC transporter permease [Candidatus Hydrogenedentota bacterium]